jgi:polyhydroxyalkanoate synthesis regulator phasin
VVAATNHACPSTADAAKVSSTIRDQVPGQAKKLQKEGELTLENAKSSLSSLGKDLKVEANKVDAKVSKLSSDAANKLDQTGRDVHAAGSKAVNEFDKNVNEVSDSSARYIPGEAERSGMFCQAGGRGHRWAGGDEHSDGG